jgi:hypothetical protein
MLTDGFSFIYIQSLFLLQEIFSITEIIRFNHYEGKF